MTKNNLKQIILLLVLTIFLVGFMFFQKDREEESYSENNEAQQLAILEQKKAENILSNFVVAYYSYNTGDFSNIESLYPLMTEKMARAEKTKIEEIKIELANQPKTYQKVTADFRGLSTEEFGSDKIITNVIIFKQIFNGAYIQDPSNKGQFILVDQYGQLYSDDMSTLLLSKDLKAFRVTGNKENGEWKIDHIEESVPKTVPEAENIEITDEEDTVILE
jgi:uncharacterized protein (UPF0333 family)